jgi:hypothetical protein
MRKGYLVLETRPERPGLVSIHALEHAPRPARPGLRFAAWFADIDAALMHFHEAVRRSLAALEPRQYRVEIDEAIAVADAIALEHRRVFVDPDLAAAQRNRIEARIVRLRARHRRRDQWLNAIGIAALLLLIAWGFMPL